MYSLFCVVQMRDDFLSVRWEEPFEILKELIKIFNPFPT